jgi:DUF4097 and DUF4098 domain-containing protein YvlB
MKQFLLFCVVFVVFSATSTGSDIKKEFRVKPGQKLEVDLQSGGDIIISGWNEEKVSVQANLEGRNAKGVRVDVTELPSGVSVTSDIERRHRNWNTDIEFHIKVPLKFDLDLHTAGGKISIDNVEGDIQGVTMGGALDLAKLKGTIDLKTMGGEVKLRSSEADGEVKTNGGNVLLRDVIGNVSGHSMGGSVTYDNVTDRLGKSTGKEVTITTMGGEINVDHAPYGANLSTMGGDISIHSAHQYVKAKTMGGNIDIDTIDGSVNAVTMGGDVSVNMTGDPNEGNRDVHIESKGGDITLVVPDALSMEVDITLAYTRDNDRWENGRRPKIISDFDLQKDETTEWERKHGSARKYIYGKGSIGGGKNKIHIETINGDVRLKKASSEK